MKITQKQLKQVIQEEIEILLEEEQLLEDLQGGAILEDGTPVC